LKTGEKIVYGSGSSSSSSTPTSTSTTTTSTPTSASSKSSGGSQDIDMADVQAVLADTNLSDDEKKAIEAVYRAVANGDQEEAQRLAAKLELAKAYADPMLERQIALITDDLNRTIEGMDYDLEYQETTLQNRLNDLRDDVQYKKDYLSLELQQELKDLEIYFGNKIQETRDTMAARGMTVSRRNEKKQELLNEQRGDMVETANRRFGAEMRNLDTTLERSERDTSREAERLRELTERGKLDVARQAEANLGTERAQDLGALGGISPIGNIEGEVDLNYQDQLANFAF